MQSLYLAVFDQGLPTSGYIFFLYFYVLHSSPYFMLLTVCKRVFSTRVENSVNPDQMASSEAN